MSIQWDMFEINILVLTLKCCPKSSPERTTGKSAAHYFVGGRYVLWETRRKAEEECFAPKSFASRKIADFHYFYAVSDMKVESRNLPEERPRINNNRECRAPDNGERFAPFALKPFFCTKRPCERRAEKCCARSFSCKCGVASKFI